MMAGRSILLTGGSGRIGKILLAHFWEMGNRLFVTTRNPDSLERLLARYAAPTGQLQGVAVDLVDSRSVEMVMAGLQKAGFAPECLINNARSIDFLRIEPNGLVSRESFLNEYLIDVVVPYELTMALAEASKGEFRRVVNIGSQYGVVAANRNLYSDFMRQSPIHYSVAKAAVGHLTKELAVRLGQKGILVNCVAYGGIEGRVDDQFKERYAQLCPLGRMLTDEDIAGPVDMLISDRASGVTGHTLVVDAGWSIW